MHDARAIGALPPDPAPHQEHQQHDFPLKRIYAIGVSVCTSMCVYVCVYMCE